MYSEHAVAPSVLPTGATDRCAVDGLRVAVNLCVVRFTTVNGPTVDTFVLLPCHLIILCIPCSSAPSMDSLHIPSNTLIYVRLSLHIEYMEQYSSSVRLFHTTRGTCVSQTSGCAGQRQSEIVVESVGLYFGYMDNIISEADRAKWTMFKK